MEHGLDIIVRPDLSSWRWKDGDELEWSIRQGLYSRSEATALYAEWERAVEQRIRERARWEGWRSWMPPPDWGPAVLPSEWDQP